jgi:hypothetical protein
MKFVFFTEEPSMKILLDGMLPRLMPESKEPPIVISHRGKSDLKRSLRNKLRSWQGAAQFIVLHDQDSNDCITLKQELNALCPREKDVLIRIVCRELESWYLGDFEALSLVYGQDFNHYAGKSKFRKPDQLNNAKEELQKILGNLGYQPLAHAKQIAPHLRLEGNQSASFNVFLQGLQRLLQEAS